MSIRIQKTLSKWVISQECVFMFEHPSHKNSDQGEVPLYSKLAS